MGLTSRARGGSGQGEAPRVYYRAAHLTRRPHRRSLNLGSSAAQSVLLMLVVIGLTALQFRVLERKVTYS